MGLNPFARCSSLTTITLNNNDNFIFEDDCLYDINKTRLITYLSSNKRTSFTIPETVKIIDIDVFVYSSIESIILH